VRPSTLEPRAVTFPAARHRPLDGSTARRQITGTLLDERLCTWHPFTKIHKVCPGVNKVLSVAHSDLKHINKLNIHVPSAISPSLSLFAKLTDSHSPNATQLLSKIIYILGVVLRFVYVFW